MLCVISVVVVHFLTRLASSYLLRDVKAVLVKEVLFTLENDLFLCTYYHYYYYY